MSANLYEKDHVAWLSEQAQLLRSGNLISLDAEHLAEELELEMGNERRELYRRLRVLIAHLLKWKYQPGMRSSSWAGTIRVQRKDIGRIFKESPSMKRYLEEEAKDAYEDALELARFETGKPENIFPESSLFRTDEILDKDFWPD